MMAPQYTFISSGIGMILAVSSCMFTKLSLCVEGLGSIPIPLTGNTDLVFIISC